jgi:mannose-6-phosphate isomerase-like protein (cupin superfamily)
MRILASVSTCVLISTAAWAQAPAPASPPTPTDKASYMSAADIAATLAKMPKTGNSSNMRVFGLAPYNVNIERRQPVAQNASVHEANAELFYIIDGAATMLTGGKLVGETRNGTNLTAKTIDGGVRQKLGKGDFFMVPAGIPHQFVDPAPTGITIMSLYLPNAK